MRWLCLFLLHNIIKSWRKLWKRDSYFLFGIQSFSIFKHINISNIWLSLHARVQHELVSGHSGLKKKINKTYIIFYTTIWYLVSTAKATPLITTDDAPGIRDAQVENHWSIVFFCLGTSEKCPIPLGLVWHYNVIL